MAALARRHRRRRGGGAVGLADHRRDGDRMRPHGRRRARPGQLVALERDEPAARRRRGGDPRCPRRPRPAARARAPRARRRAGRRCGARAVAVLDAVEAGAATADAVAGAHRPRRSRRRWRRSARLERDGYVRGDAAGRWSRTALTPPTGAGEGLRRGCPRPLESLAVDPARTPVALAIAGSDSGGGAGIQADLKAFAAVGVHGTTAITAITAQNTVGVDCDPPVPPEIIVAQVAAVAEDIGVDAVKVGMLGTIATIDAVARRSTPSATRRSCRPGDGLRERRRAPRRGRAQRARSSGSCRARASSPRTCPRPGPCSAPARTSRRRSWRRRSARSVPPP